MKERRLELRFKGLRWMDLKRLGINKSITHILYDETHTYDPSQGEYYMPIPSNVLELNPKL